MNPCISQHADPAALGETDIRARAITAGWREDALGQLACPACQQASPLFRAAAPVMLSDPAAATMTGCAAVPAGGNHNRGSDAGVMSAMRTMLITWCSHPGQGGHRRARWPQLLTGLAGERNGWDVPHRVPATDADGRSGSASPGVHTRSPHRAARHAGRH
jgi:hypothetical protein